VTNGEEEAIEMEDANEEDNSWLINEEAADEQRTNNTKSNIDWNEFDCCCYSVNSLQQKCGD
jgi:hypothetical protein